MSERKVECVTCEAIGKSCCLKHREAPAPVQPLPEVNHPDDDLLTGSGKYLAQPRAPISWRNAPVPVLLCQLTHQPCGSVATLAGYECGCVNCVKWRSDQPQAAQPVAEPPKYPDVGYNSGGKYPPFKPVAESSGDCGQVGRDKELLEAVDKCLDELRALLIKRPDRMAGQFCGHKANEGHPIDWNNLPPLYALDVCTLPPSSSGLSVEEIARKHFPELKGTCTGIDWNKTSREQCEAAIRDYAASLEARLGTAERDHHDAMILVRKWAERSNEAEAHAEAVETQLKTYAEQVAFDREADQNRIDVSEARNKELEQGFDKELKRWQDHIYEMCKKVCRDNGVAESAIDGGGCDSGDPLDFTEAEISQAFGIITERADFLSLLLREAITELGNLIDDNPPNKFRLMSLLTRLSSDTKEEK